MRANSRERAGRTRMRSAVDAQHIQPRRLDKRAAYPSATASASARGCNAQLKPTAAASAAIHRCSTIAIRSYNAAPLPTATTRRRGQRLQLAAESFAHDFRAIDNRDKRVLVDVAHEASELNRLTSRKHAHDDRHAIARKRPVSAADSCRSVQLGHDKTLDTQGGPSR